MGHTYTHTQTVQSSASVVPWQGVVVLFPERLTLLVSSGLISVSCTSCSSSIFLLITVKQPVQVRKKGKQHIKRRSKRKIFFYIRVIKHATNDCTSLIKLPVATISVTKTNLDKE